MLVFSLLTCLSKHMMFFFNSPSYLYIVVTVLNLPVSQIKVELAQIIMDNQILPRYLRVFLLIVFLLYAAYCRLKMLGDT